MLHCAQCSAQDFGQFSQIMSVAPLRYLNRNLTQLSECVHRSCTYCNVRNLQSSGWCGDPVLKWGEVRFGWKYLWQGRQIQCEHPAKANTVNTEHWTLNTEHTTKLNTERPAKVKTQVTAVALKGVQKSARDNSEKKRLIQPRPLLLLRRE